MYSAPSMDRVMNYVWNTGTKRLICIQFIGICKRAQCSRTCKRFICMAIHYRPIIWISFASEIEVIAHELKVKENSVKKQSKGEIEFPGGGSDEYKRGVIFYLIQSSAACVHHG